jgi:hypothetical protein
MDTLVLIVLVLAGAYCGMEIWDRLADLANERWGDRRRP